MQTGSWQAVLAASADPVRASAHLRLVAEACEPGRLDRLSEPSRRILVSLLACSRALSTWLQHEPAWLELFDDPDYLRHPRRREGLEREVEAGLAAAIERGDFVGALEGLHRFRRREQLRIAARDTSRLGSTPEIMLELSNAADVFLEGVLRVVRRQITDRLGFPWHKDPGGIWRPTPFSVIGLGKLGGQELNYSSDVDLLLVYGDEGTVFRKPPTKRTTGGGGLRNHSFFKRLGELFVREATIRGVDAGALRIDLRLRPEGDAGPLARSLDSFENFYAAWGRSWERLMLIKARSVAGDVELAAEFLEVIQPFRYPRSLGEGLLREMAEMKARTEREVVRAGELERDVKLGRGGIREIEFVAQALQVLHAGSNPFLQTPHTLEALPKLASYRLLPARAAVDLTRAYPFLRDVEHRLQMEEQRQTHTLPEAPEALRRIARSLGFPNLPAFRRALARHTRRVRSVYDRILGDRAGKAMPSTDSDALPLDFADAAEGTALLAQHGFRDPDKGLRLLREFVQGPGFVHVSKRTTDLGLQLVPRLLELCPGAGVGRIRNPRSGARAWSTPAAGGGAESGTGGTAGAMEPFVISDPDRVVARLDTYVQAYGARGSLYELWNARPAVFEHILKLFDRSEFLAELAIRSPDRVDELELGGHLRRTQDAVQTLEDLRHGAHDADQHLWLRRYFQTEFVRLGLRDILGWVDDLDANAELSALAEACVQYALETVTRRNRLKYAPFAVIGLGKLGGRELVYGSDLDVVFVAPERCRNLPRLQKLAGEMIDLLTRPTEDGSVFVLDARLRPDGDKGLLVNTLGAYETYYRERAMLWEIQALTRARAVAGDAATGTAFESMARELTDFTGASRLSARTPDWRRQIHRMRHRIEVERTPSGQEALAFKTGAGGLVDVEFLAQSLSMEHGWFEPNTLRSLEAARDRGVLDRGDAESLLGNFRELRRMESILRRWSFEGEAVLPEDPAAQARVAIRCGYANAPAFLADVARWRSEIRAVFDRHMAE
jgi:glutamate-ammonia-ligase adenylyltransferase